MRERILPDMGGVWSGRPLWLSRTTLAFPVNQGREVRYLRYGLLAVVVLLLAAACSDDTPKEGDAPKEGPVTVVNEVDFSMLPVTGTFEVTEGADVLGCSSGTFVDRGLPKDGIQRVYTCDSGSNEGSFTTGFTFVAFGSSDSGDNGTWSVVGGSDDFVGLQGSGDWSIVYGQTGPDGSGIWTGDVNHTS